jgi:hypothetical protein
MERRESTTTTTMAHEESPRKNIRVRWLMLSLARATLEARRAFCNFAASLVQDEARFLIRSKKKRHEYPIARDRRFHLIDVPSDLSSMSDARARTRSHLLSSASHSEDNPHAGVGK